MFLILFGVFGKISGVFLSSMFGLLLQLSSFLTLPQFTHQFWEA